MDKELVKGIIWKFLSYKAEVEGGKLEAGLEIDLAGLKAEAKTLIPGGVDDLVIDAIFQVVFGV